MQTPRALRSMQMPSALRPIQMRRALRRSHSRNVHTMDTFVQQLINGLNIGAIYALIALGYTMVYGILRLINFAHGDVYMLGAFFGFYAARLTGAAVEPNPFKATGILLLSMLGCGLVGFLIERFAYKPVRKSSRLAALITAIG